MARTIWLWLLSTAALAALLAGVASRWEHPQAWNGMAMGIGVSLATLVASKTTVAASGIGHKPLSRMLIETSVRMALPLSFLLAMAVARRELLNETFLLYFLPFQFITILVGTATSIHKIEQQA